MKAYLETIHELADVKECYDHVREFYRTFRYEIGSLQCHLKQIYDTMIKNIENRTYFQYTAKIEDILIGHIVACDVGNFEMEIKSVMVEKRFQKTGVARQMIKKLRKVAKESGFKVLKIEEREGANGFFARAGFIPYLYVTIKGGENVDLVKKGNINKYQVINEGKVGNDYIIKYDIEEEAVQIDKSFFLKNKTNVEVCFIYERKLYKEKPKKLPPKKEFQKIKIEREKKELKKTAPKEK